MWSGVVKAGREVNDVGVEFTNSFGKRVGDGRDTKFWEESWLGNVTFK